MAYIVKMDEYVEGKVVDTDTFTFDSEEDREDFAESVYRSYTMITEIGLEDGFDTGYLMTYEES